MGKPVRTFIAKEGQDSIGSAGPSQISHDLDNLFAALDPEATFKDGGAGGIGLDNLKPEAKIPTGIITMWSGSIDSMPAGWHLCDGTAGTPDLRDRFIVGAGSGYSVGAKGGAKTVSISSHAHSVSFQSGPAPQSGMNAGMGGGFASYLGHRHSISGNTGSAGSASLENRPPYYALALIMKL